MPIYSYKCPSCGLKFDRFLPLKDYQSLQECEECGELTVKQIVAPAILTDYEGYSCPITGQWVEGRRQHEENLKRHGCRVLESGEKQETDARRKRADEDFDRKIEETAEQFIAGLPPRKLEKLASEMEAGLTATVIRQ